MSDKIWQNPKLYFKYPYKKASSIPCIFSKNIRMFCINKNTDDRNDIMVGNTGVTVPSKMINSSKILDPIVERLINLVEVDEDTLNGNSVIATAFRQQGITTFKHLCNFPYYAEFYGRFTYYKEKDADVNTTHGNDIAIPYNVLVSIH